MTGEAYSNSHAHAEQVLARHAWQGPVAALAGTQAAMQQRCADCLAALTQDLGKAALRGTRIKLPEPVLAHGHKPGHAANPLLARFNLGRAWREMEVLWLGQEPMAQACAG